MTIWKLVMAAAMLVPGAAWAQSKCHAPEWRTVNDSVAGAVYDMPAPPTRSHFIASGIGFPSAQTREMIRSGPQVSGRCSSFSVHVVRVGDNYISNPKGFFDTEQANAIKGLTEGKIVSSRSLTIGGYPAREYQFTFLTDYTRRPARHRVLLVVRGSQLLNFTWVWGDAGPPPEDSNRSFASIRLIPADDAIHMASFALLQESIENYWIYPSSDGDNGGIYFTSALRSRLDARRAEDTRVIAAFGFPRELRFLRRDGAAKVIRSEHDNAVVDWTITDNGKTISAISWQKR